MSSSPILQSNSGQTLAIQDVLDFTLQSTSQHEQDSGILGVEAKTFGQPKANNQYSGANSSQAVICNSLVILKFHLAVLDKGNIIFIKCGAGAIYCPHPQMVLI